jgi:hypothetical protein
MKKRNIILFYFYPGYLFLIIQGKIDNNSTTICFFLEQAGKTGSWHAKTIFNTSGYWFQKPVPVLKQGTWKNY